MTAYGPWRDDSLPTWVNAVTTYGDNLGNGAQGTVGLTWQCGATGSGNTDAATQAWNGTGTITGGPGSGTANSGLQLQNGGASWNVGWVTSIRPATVTCSTGTLPPTVLTGFGAWVDPNVIGVEWEPSTTVVDQRVQITPGTPAHAGGNVVSTPARFVLGAYSPAGLYDPGFLTRTQVMGRENWTYDLANAVVIPMPASATGIAIGGVDGWTWGGDLAAVGIPESDPTDPTHLWQQTFNWTQIIQCAFTPRYRLIYQGTVLPPLRQDPRTDGLGASATRRVWPPARSAQGSNRQTGYL